MLGKKLRIGERYKLIESSKQRMERIGERIGEIEDSRSKRILSLI